MAIILRWPTESICERPVHRARALDAANMPPWMVDNFMQTSAAVDQGHSRPSVDPPAAGVRAMNVRIIILNGAWLLSAVAVGRLRHAE